MGMGRPLATLGWGMNIQGELLRVSRLGHTGVSIDVGLMDLIGCQQILQQQDQATQFMTTLPYTRSFFAYFCDFWGIACKWCIPNSHG